MKVIDKATITDQNMLEQTLNEIQILEKLNHESITRLLTYFENE